MSKCRVIRWTARVLSLVSIGVLLLFLVGESFDPLRISPQEWVGLLFFPVVLCIGMIAAWRWELTGGAITVLSLIAFYLAEWLFSGNFPGGPYFVVFAVPGFLYLIAWACRNVFSGRAYDNPSR